MNSKHQKIRCLFADGGEDAVYHTSPISPTGVQVGRDLVIIMATAYFSYSPVSLVDGVELTSERPLQDRNVSLLDWIKVIDQNHFVLTSSDSCHWIQPIFIHIEQF